MKWQVEYALKNLSKDLARTKAEHIDGEVIMITTENKPNVVAIISDAMEINKGIVQHYINEAQEVDFICGYRKECVWEGEAIKLLQSKNIGWGSFGTLSSAALYGNANFAEHKTYTFSNRLIHQYGIIESVNREYDRIFQVRLKNGRDIRIGMIPDYEPTAENVRKLWERFGALDIAWNINPNGEPTESAQTAGKELGCNVLKTEGMKAYLQSL
tara:strand:- start:9481 stop:10122 length:642 start_codon:yes stop_codon:yes gene_type:complete